MAYVELIGYIWQPGVGICAYGYELRDYDLRNILAEAITGDVEVTPENLAARFTRERVADWLAMNAGDFQRVTDFRAVAGDVELAWADEESEFAYNDAMYGSEN
jgi:hypothetical protein